MPTYATDAFIFLHVPKTGGNWVLKALMDINPHPNFYYPSHLPLNRLEEYFPGASKLYKFTFVRHPLTWWQSTWRHRATHGWNPKELGLDRFCQSDTYDDFLRLAHEHCYQYCTRSFLSMCGPPEAPVDFIGRYESLHEDLISVLQNFMTVDEARIRALPPENSSKRVEATYTPALVDLIYRQEQAMFERFGYDPYLPSAF